MKTLKDYLVKESHHYTDDELKTQCHVAWGEACAQDYCDPDKTSEDDIDDMAYEILQFGFDDVDDLSDKDFDKCVEILKSFLK